MAAARTALEEVNKGEFKRTAAGFRNKIEPGGRFEPEADRYHLYVSFACPWACRTVATMYMKVRLKDSSSSSRQQYRARQQGQGQQQLTASERNHSSLC
jgi:glutathionyl-hydroquinone reductase